MNVIKNPDSTPPSFEFCKSLVILDSFFECLANNISTIPDISQNIPLYKWFSSSIENNPKFIIVKYK